MVKTKAKPKKMVPKAIPRKRREQPTPTKIPRSYTDAERAAAMALLLANDYALRQTARETGIPMTTLRNWAAEGVHPAPPALVAIAATELDSLLTGYIAEGVGINPREFPRLSFVDHCRALAMLVDKVCALRGNASTIVGFKGQMVNANIGDGKPAGDPNVLSPGQMGTLMNIFHRMSGRTDTIFAPAPGEPGYDPGLDEPTEATPEASP